MTRFIDIVVSAILLLLTAPLFLLIAVLIKLDSPGPVFFRQERYGRGRAPFRIWKFRKMRDDLPTQGASVTARFDPRMTTAGRWLERTKLDELPQLINVLVGDMTLVGPRPESPDLTDPRYDDIWDVVFSVKPGIVGPNQIRCRNESELYPEDCEDRQQYYLDRILPEKLTVDAEYARTKRLLSDARLFFASLWATVAGTVTRETMVSKKHQFAYMAMAVALGQVSIFFAYALRFDGDFSPGTLANLYVVLLLMPLARLIGFYLARVHKCIHSIFTVSDAIRILFGVCLGSAMSVGALVLLDLRMYSRSVFLIDAILLSLILCGANYLVDRIIFLRSSGRRLRELRVVLADVLWTFAAGLVGAGTIGAAVGAYQIRYLGSELAGAALGRIMVGVFVSRAVVFGVLLFRTRGLEGRPALVLTDGMRPIVEALAAAFFVDLCCVFFLNVRGLSRMAFAAHNLAFFPFMMGLVALRASFRQRVGADAADEDFEDRVSRILIVGDGRETALVVSALANIRYRGFAIAGILAYRSNARTNSIAGAEVIGVTADIEDILDLHRIDTVVVMKEGATAKEVTRVLRACRSRGVYYRVVPDMLSFLSKLRAPRRAPATVTNALEEAVQEAATEKS